MAKQTKRWMKLDNAAKIYPASQSRKWMALFRLSAVLTEPVNPSVLQEALQRTLHRFPSFSQRLRSGVFWNYFEQLDGTPEIQKDVMNPCMRMRFRENGGFMFRVRYYGKRIAVEFFHVLTDGTGGFCFLKTLVAEYLTQRYGVVIPRSSDILDCTQNASAEELEDGYLKHARYVPRSRKEASAYCIPGKRVRDFMFITTGILDAKAVAEAARRYHATVTEFLVAALILSVDPIQRSQIFSEKKLKPVKICVPVNLRKYYGSNTMRNFASYINPGIEPRYGEYDFAETVRLVHGQMAVETNEKLLNAKFSTNVLSEQNLFLRIAPWFLKKQAMKLVFKFKGDRQSSTTISNLGAAALPPEMGKYVSRMDFMLGPLSRNRVACACLSYRGRLIINFTRTIRNSAVERNFFTMLVKMGLHVKVESNLQRLQQNGAEEELSERSGL